MSSNKPTVDMKATEDRLMRYLAIEGVSGEEKAIAAAIVKDLKAVGVFKSSTDTAKFADRITENVLA